jgi:hypothetical protein
MMHFCSGETEKKMEVRWVDGDDTIVKTDGIPLASLPFTPYEADPFPRSSSSRVVRMVLRRVPVV